MLAPDDRTLLADLLLPPEGFKLEHAVATTFTLDLTALLTVPLGFAGSDLVANTNQLAILQSVREYADRIDIFAQRGMVKVPAKPNSLLAFLEEMIHQVGVPRPGFLFHPKVWVLRFSLLGGDKSEGQKFRLICGSRNLTFDRSWDAAVILEGIEERRRYAVNNPLCTFLQSLPARAGGMADFRQRRFAETISRLNNAEWEKPAGVADVNGWLRFHSLGHVASRQPDLSSRRLLIVSPFLNGEGLRQFEDCDQMHVISRGEQLDSLDEADRDWVCDPESSLFTLDDDASIRDLEDEETGVRWELTGLHAKIYAFERGHYTHVIVGSANATKAAWSGNDEFLVELVGKRRDFGVDTLIGPDSPFRNILIQHTFGEKPEVDHDEDVRRMLENKLREIAATEFMATINGNDSDGWAQTVRSELALNISVPNVEVALSLVTRPFDRIRSKVGEAADVSWRLDGLEETTPFVIIELTLGRVKVAAVLLVRLEGGPRDRLDRVLANQFSDEATFLQFVALLLVLGGGEGTSHPDAFLDGTGGFLGSWATSGIGLLEALLKALARSPSTIDDVERLVGRLRATESGRQVLPEGWDDLWSAVMYARVRLEVQS
jgi:hypothetical protein